MIMKMMLLKSTIALVAISGLKVSASSNEEAGGELSRMQLRGGARELSDGGDYCD